MLLNQQHLTAILPNAYSPMKASLFKCSYVLHKWSGDLGYKDEDGYFWIVGRTDDIIFVNGVNINPCDVEECLISHQAVLACAVVSSPDPLGQASVKAFVVLSSDFKNKEPNEMIKELQDYVTKKTGAWMSPRKIEFVDAFPTTLTGKINRNQLKQKEWNQF
ncbi:acyl-coenzyme A synthetase ACSM3, mitochondrial-like [Orbicella faveolata]|uniref:acyl-coenzyme A synthetase ACSM3, mitochondrial-like n=1 Tax=Orbicella faveolata TaxID=48498 RepID=UPI0009E3CD22|nr:acyl-coenzyme A synthetase ACSM3, mitochondrial-like [Orbicella faveolata]